MKKSILIMVVGTVAASAVYAGGVKYKNEDGDYVKLGGRIQLQYHMVDPDGGESSDELLFRRLRPYIEGSVHEDWKGKFQFDLGKSSLAVKDAYFQYGGIENTYLRFGNASFAFSRELLTSSKKQQLVERTFVGDHNYGTPDRQAGVHAGTKLLDEMLFIDVSAAQGAIDPSNSKLDFDTMVNRDDDFIEGNMVGGRIEFFPLGHFKPEQGDFKGDLKAAVAVGAFAWQNDDDNVVEVDEGEDGENVDDVTGLEVSAALRGYGVSVDAQYNRFDASLSDGAAGATGIYKDGETILENYAVEGGVMVLPKRVELVGGFEAQDADGYDKTWTRTSVGLNYFVKKQDIKYQLTYRMGENLKGKDGSDENELFVQAQYVF